MGIAPGQGLLVLQVRAGGAGPHPFGGVLHLSLPSVSGVACRAAI